MNLSIQGHAASHQYGVLVQISLGYPPVTGRLHTRYAPVRRSPAEYCYSPLPLDLHVLSLPLAFILSQDQTLHCKNFLNRLLFLWLVLVSRRTPCARPTHAISFSICFKSLSPSSLSGLFFNTPFFCRKRLQRYDHFPFPQNYFCTKSKAPVCIICISAH